MSSISIRSISTMIKGVDVEQEESRPLRQLGTTETPLCPSGKVDGQLRPLRTVEGQLRPSGKVEGSLRPSRKVEGPLRPLRKVEGPLRPLRTVEGPLRPLITVEGPLRPLRKVEGPLRPLITVEGPLRPLGKLEEQFYNYRHIDDGIGMVIIALVVETRVPLQVTVLRTALQHVHQQLPMLRTRLQQRGNVPWLMTSRAAVQLDELPVGDDWIYHYEHITKHTSLNETAGPLWRSYLLLQPVGLPAEPAQSGTHRAVIYMCYNHVIMDGMGVTVVNGRLLEALDRLMRGTPLQLTRCNQTIAESMEALLDHSGLTRLGRLRFTAGALHSAIRSVIDYRRGRSFSSLFTRAYSRHQVYRFRILAASLPAEHTGSLLALCRRHAVQVNSALSAAVALAAARLAAQRRPERFGLPFAVRCSWMKNMRPYLNTSVDTSSLVLNCIGGIHQLVTVSSLHTSSFWQLAERIQLMVTNAVVGKEALYGSLVSSNDEKSVAFLHRQPLVDLFINNYGATDGRMTHFPSVRLKQQHLSGRYTPQMTYQSFAMVYFHTVDNVLGHNLLFYEGQVEFDDAHEYSRQIMEVLQAIITESG